MPPKRRHITLEQRIEKAIAAHERATGERVVWVDVQEKKEIGFNRRVYRQINYGTK